MNMRLIRLIMVGLCWHLFLVARAKAESPVDICKKIPPEMVRTLLFGDEGGKLDSWSNQLNDNHAQCLWAATIGSDSRQMTLDVNAYGSVATARKNMIDGTPLPASASTAQLAGQDDQVMHLNTFEVEVRHKNVVAILDASGAEISAAPSVYQYWLDAAALSAAGASVQPPPFSPNTEQEGQGSTQGR